MFFIKKQNKKKHAATAVFLDYMCSFVSPRGFPDVFSDQGHGCGDSRVRVALHGHYDHFWHNM